MDDNVFWSDDSKGKPSIIQARLLNNLKGHGFCNLETGKYDKTTLVRIKNNIVENSNIAGVGRFLYNQVKQSGNQDVEEIFVRGITNYITPRKLDFLDVETGFFSADNAKKTWFYYQNTAVRVGKRKIKLIPYENLPHLIWKESILQRDFSIKKVGKSQFEKFCRNISGSNIDRFIALKTNIGYLLSTYKDPGNPKAVIFVDERMDLMGAANGGTGKSLIAMAIGHMRNMVTVDGKNYNPSYPFSNQRVEMSTDVICFDDMGKNFNLENIFSMTTSGITVNQKHKQEYYIEPENAPKIMINSNYIVKGPGGNADKRRRSEFEVAAHYNDSRQPFDDFGNMFFQGWDEDEWKRFDSFMIECAQEYLKEGLIIAPPINLAKNRLVMETSKEFVEYMGQNIKINIKIDKRDFLKGYKDQYGVEVSSHKFTKMLKSYADEKDLIYEDKSSGGKYYFRMKDNNPKKEASSNEKEGNNLQSPE